MTDYKLIEPAHINEVRWFKEILFKNMITSIMLMKDDDCRALKAKINNQSLDDGLSYDIMMEFYTATKTANQSVIMCIIELHHKIVNIGSIDNRRAHEALLKLVSRIEIEQTEEVKINVTKCHYCDAPATMRCQDLTCYQICGRPLCFTHQRVVTEMHHVRVTCPNEHSECIVS